jgi:hypothetical protein
MSVQTFEVRLRGTKGCLVSEDHQTICIPAPLFLVAAAQSQKHHVSNTSVGVSNDNLAAKHDRRERMVFDYSQTGVKENE